MKLFIYLVISIFPVAFFGKLTTRDSHPVIIENNQNLATDKITFDDRTYVDNIRTVELYRSGWRLSPPVRNLRDTSSLNLEFDDISEDLTHYTYTVVHCSADWQPSDLVSSQYLDGLAESDIRDYRYSRNALQNYTHYRLMIPNDDIRPKLPGNYILYVYRDYDQEQPVLTRRFFLVDPLVSVDMDVHRADDVRYLYTSQEVDFTVNYGNSIRPDDPSRNFRVTVCQNFNWQTALTTLQPRFINPGQLIYNYEDVNLFQGGSEFRHFDTKSLKFNSDRVRQITYEPPLKHVYLLQDHPKGSSAYEFQEDINGKFLVKWDDAFDSDTEADYVMVHFYLNTGQPIGGQDIYLFGELTDWHLDDHNRLAFDEASGCYEITLPFKQGYYNYAYAARGTGDGKTDLTMIDGSHYETENDYYVFVYYRDIKERFDRLVGFQTANSIKQSRD